MTQLPANNDAWRRAGADAKAPASGEQIQRDVATEPGGTASSSPAGGDEREGSVSQQEQASPDEANERDHLASGTRPETP